MNAIRSSPTLGPIYQWIVKRGILYGLTQAPMIALVVGSFFKWTSYPVATIFTVILAFAVLPPWVLYRRSVSDDPDEPVHHLHKYALWSLVPYIVYNFARVPMHYLLQIVFWDHWYDFGSELTGIPVDQWGSLLPGTFIHSLQGYVLALGFFILYKKHNFWNALIYVWIFLSLIYTWLFPTFVLVDFQPPPKWFFVVWWAHFWMALAAWYVPKALYSSTFWSRFKTTGSRTLMIIVIVLVYIFPIAFVFWRVGTWQFDFQNGIDQTVFDAARLEVSEGPTLVEPAEESGFDEAHYTFTLRFGPRPYKDYINATKALDAGPIQVSGRIVSDGSIIAWCSAYVPAIESPNLITVPADYFPALQRMEFTDIPVECVGPVAGADGLSAAELVWTADVTLIGDRNRLDKRYEGTSPAVVARR